MDNYPWARFVEVGAVHKHVLGAVCFLQYWVSKPLRVDALPEASSLATSALAASCLSRSALSSSSASRSPTAAAFAFFPISWRGHPLWRHRTTISQLPWWIGFSATVVCMIRHFDSLHWILQSSNTS